MENNGLAAFCGLYCGACSLYRAWEDNDEAAQNKLMERYQTDKPEDAQCRGCKSDKVNRICQRCTFRDCATGKGIEHCGQCESFPCSELQTFEADDAAHHTGIIDKLHVLKEQGSDKWIVAQEERWSCPTCGKKTTWYATECPKCGTALRCAKIEDSEIRKT